MIKIGLLFLLMQLPTAVWSTECKYNAFTFGRVRLSICQNQSSYSETKTLLFKARAQLLSKMMADLISNGKLTDKKFELQIKDPIIDYDYVAISQDSRAYYVTYVGFATIYELSSILTYFTRSDWKSFIYSPSEEDSGEIKQRFMNGLRGKFAFKLEDYLNKDYPVWDFGAISLVYKEDMLRYTMNKKTLDYEVSSQLPIPIKDRFLFLEKARISVYLVSKGAILEKQIKPLAAPDKFVIEKSDEWINIMTISGDSYSYSYIKNKIYTLKESNNP